MNVLATQGLRWQLRSATAAAHDLLDNAFAELDLSSRDGLETFLRAHYLAWSAMTPVWLSFFERDLGRSAPDYAAMLECDLADLGSPISPMTCANETGRDCPAAVCYVLAGSRMGMEMIRRQPNWGRSSGLAQRYFEDDSGPGLFKAATAFLNETAIDSSAAIRVALETFALFDQALTKARG